MLSSTNNQYFYQQQASGNAGISSQDAAVQSLPNLNEIKAIPQFEMVKVHGDKLLDSSQHTFVERSMVKQQPFVSTTTSTGPVLPEAAPIVQQPLLQKPMVMERDILQETKERVFIKSLDDIQVNEQDSQQWHMRTQKAYSNRLEFDLQLYPKLSDEQRQSHISQLQGIMDEYKFKGDAYKKGGIESKIFNIFDPIYSCACADTWSYSEVMSFGREPGRIFKLQHQLFPNQRRDFKNGDRFVGQRDAETELVDPITSAIHCAAMEAKLKLKSVRPSHDILELWKSQSKFDLSEGRREPSTFNTAPVLNQQLPAKSLILQQQQQLLPAPVVQQSAPLIQQQPLMGSSSGTTTRNVQVTRVEERIDIQEQTVPIQQQQQSLPIQSVPIVQQPRQQVFAQGAGNTVMLPQQVQPILAHVQPGTFLEEQIIGGAKPMMQQQIPPSRL